MRSFVSYWRSLAGAAATATLLAIGASAAHATDYTADTLSTDTTLDEDPLHGFCWGTTPGCYDNGQITPFNSPDPQFGFSISPQSQVGYFYLDFLVPTNDVPANPSTLTFTVTGDQGGSANNISGITGTSQLVSTTPWTSGKLENYIPGRATSSPSNPIDAFLPFSQNLDPGATGYYVYEVRLSGDPSGPNAGKNRLAGPSSPTSGPLLQLSSSGGGSTTLALGTLIVGFLNTGTFNAPSWIATAPSGALLDVPEPAGILVIAGGLALFGAARWLRTARASA